MSLAPDVDEAIGSQTIVELRSCARVRRLCAKPRMSVENPAADIPVPGNHYAARTIERSTEIHDRRLEATFVFMAIALDASDSEWEKLSQ